MQDSLIRMVLRAVGSRHLPYQAGRCLDLWALACWVRRNEFLKRETKYARNKQPPAMRVRVDCFLRIAVLVEVLCLSEDS